jgi:flagella basal body P-ring formation protein FlgA
MNRFPTALFCLLPLSAWSGERVSLADAAERFAESSASLPAGSVRAVAIDPQIPLGNCPSGWQWSFPYEARTTVQVTCTASPTPSRRLVAVRYLLDETGAEGRQPVSTPPRRHLVAARDMAIGAVLSAEDLELQDLPARGRAFSSTLSDPASLVGLSLTRSVRKGESLGRADARSAQVIKRNSPVSAWSAFSGGRVVTRLVALQNGKAGEWITLENPQSGRKIKGLVQDDGTVKVGGGMISAEAAQVVASVVD